MVYHSEMAPLSRLELLLSKWVFLVVFGLVARVIVFVVRSSAGKGWEVFWGIGHVGI